MAEAEKAVSLHDFMTVSEAAGKLGVSPGTLRNWDRIGKLKSIRHPLNGYRLYRQSDLDYVLRQLSSIVSSLPDMNKV
jgi:excisionase family DNA binding protein